MDREDEDNSLNGSRVEEDSESKVESKNTIQNETKGSIGLAGQLPDSAYAQRITDQYERVTNIIKKKRGIRKYKNPT